jgi:hypothetical protein
MMEADDVKSPPISEQSSQSESTYATSVSAEKFSNDEDDIFDSTDNHNHSHITDGIHVPEAREEMLSDLPAVQRQHMTAGYREGLSDSKAKSMQGGFDQGYPIGFVLGIRVGRILGVLEGFLAAFAKDPAGTPEDLLRLYRSAKRELAIGQLLHGLEDEVLASLEFEVNDLPLESKEALQKWEQLVTQMMKA